MSTISIKDSLRQSIEAASNGEQTVLYTAKGQPTFMNIIKKFDLSTIDSSLSGTHPAFIVNGVEKDAIYIGTYASTLKNGELISIPNSTANITLNHDTANVNARACGAGFHLMTNAEWSAAALLSYKNLTQPNGNTYYGRSIEDATQFGRRVDGLDASAGITSGTPTTLTGSGPVTWRHNQKYNGISDLAGNRPEVTTGARLFNGEVQVIANNNAAMATTDLSASSAAWMAIDATTGLLVTPNGLGTTAGTVKLALSGTADYTLVSAQSALFSAMTNPAATNKVSAAAINTLKSLCLYPISNTGLGSDILTHFSTDERMCVRGGSYIGGISSGIFCLDATLARTATNLHSRLAYYTP